jgi:hypothetical protein
MGRGLSDLQKKILVLALDQESWAQQRGEEPYLKLMSSYGYTRRESVSGRYALGESLVGQAALVLQALGQAAVTVTAGPP